MITRTVNDTRTIIAITPPLNEPPDDWDGSVVDGAFEVVVFCGGTGSAVVVFFGGTGSAVVVLTDGWVEFTAGGVVGLGSNLVVVLVDKVVFEAIVVLPAK